MSALVMGLKEGVRDVQDAAFFPVAAFAVTLGYLLGFSAWSTRRAWSMVLLSGFLVAFIETARLVEPIRIVIRSIPQFEMELHPLDISKGKSGNTISRYNHISNAIC